MVRLTWVRAVAGLMYSFRAVFVPAVMHVLGRANWWLPGWLDRVLPRLQVEPSGVAHVAPPARSAGVERRPLFSGSRTEGGRDGKII